MLAQAIGLAVVLLAPPLAGAGPTLPILRAGGRAVDVRDGDRLTKGGWNAAPAVALDRYDARRSASGKRVTFITDIDSLSFDVQPGRTYDFVILLAGRDTCRTRLSTLTRTFTRIAPGRAAGSDTLPITIEHGKLHVRGRINGSKTLDLIFDTGADICVLYPSAAGRGARLRFDGTIHNAGTGGTTLRQTSSDNRLEIAGLRWDHEPVLYVEKQADAADGIVGYPVFCDKVLKFDYDRMEMVVHDSLPALAPGFTRTRMAAVGSLTAVEVGLRGAEKRASGLFVLDTAGNGALIVNQAFATAHGLRGALRKLGTNTSRGVGKGVLHSELDLLPELTLAGFTLRNVPIQVEQPSDGNTAPPGGALCMDVLGRFNAVIDYRHDEAYFKPNTHFDDRFHAGSSGRRAALIAAVATAIVAALATGAWRRSGRSGSTP